MGEIEQPYRVIHFKTQCEETTHTVYADTPHIRNRNTAEQKITERIKKTKCCFTHRRGAAGEVVFFEVY